MTRASLERFRQSFTLYGSRIVCAGKEMTLYHLCTAWGLVVATMLLVRLIRGPRCGHDWEPLVERELPAVADIIDKHEVCRWESAVLTYRAGRKKFFAILGCKKCGETKEFSSLSGDEPAGRESGY